MFQKLLKNNVIVTDLKELESALLSTFKVLEDKLLDEKFEDYYVDERLKKDILKSTSKIRKSIGENNATGNRLNNYYNLIMFALMGFPILSNYTNCNYSHDLRNIFLGEELLKVAVEDTDKIHKLISTVAKKLSDPANELLTKLKLMNIFLENYYIFSNDFHEECASFITFRFNLNSYRNILYNFNWAKELNGVNICLLLNKYIEKYKYYEESYKEFGVEVETDSVEERFKSLFFLLIKVEGLRGGYNKDYIAQLLDDSDVIDAWLSLSTEATLLLFLQNNLPLELFFKLIYIINEGYPNKRVINLVEAFETDESSCIYDDIKNKRLDVSKFIETYNSEQPLEWQVELLISDGVREYYE